jgi:hypothetical protein
VQREDRVADCREVLDIRARLLDFRNIEVMLAEVRREAAEERRKVTEKWLQRPLVLAHQKRSCAK